MASSARIDELRKKFEENPRRYFAPLANEYRKAGDVDQAIAICREYLPQQPGHMSGHIVYGQALYEGREFEEAKTVFETALSLDPENLIALRHLGDIALILGDTGGARGWYGRVLEADPRNEEIQAQLKSLEGGGGETSPAQVTAETPVASRAVAAPSDSAPTVVVSAMHVPVTEKTVEQPLAVPATGASSPQVETMSSAPTAEITLDNVPAPDIPALANLENLEAATPSAETSTPAADMASGFEPTAPLLETPATVEPLELESPTPSLDATAAIDSFTLEGLEPTSFDAPSPTADAPMSSLLDVEKSGDAPPEVKSAAELIEPPGETVSSAPVTAPEAVPSEVPALPTEPAPSPPAVPSIENLDLALSPAPAPAPEAEASPEPTVAADPTANLPMLDLTAQSEPAPAEDVPASEAGPFVTETMAELYLSQGHREEALRVYRALVEQRPGDAALRAKLEKMQADSGPTIRELLMRVASRRPGSRAHGTAPTQAMAGGNGASLSAPPVQASSDAGQPTPPPAGEERADGVPQDTTDAIAAFLGAPAPSPHAERSALLLASAFSSVTRAGAPSPSGAPDIHGSPARPASKDLSLDTVFGATPAASPTPASFSFDQFFAQPPATGTGETAGGNSPGQEARDDVARFTQWLEGLKQR